MDVSPVVQRLRAELPTDWVTVGGAAALDIAIDTTPATPAAYVLPLAETAEAPYLVGVQAQQMRRAFGVVIGVHNVADAAGGAAQADLSVRRQQVLAALVGWTQDAGQPDATVAFIGGQLLRFEQGRLWWMDTFETDAQLWAPLT